MRQRVSFRKVLDFLESQGWRLVRIWHPYRVFLKRGGLPILVRVEAKTVDADDFRRIQKIVADE